eukprot:COSAG01_NODE_4102_length_5348_cov_5.912555_6_plen_185_part_00
MSLNQGTSRPETSIPAPACRAGGRAASRWHLPAGEGTGGSVARRPLRRRSAAPPRRDRRPPVRGRREAAQCTPAPRAPPAPKANIRVRVKIMGLIIKGTDRDFPTIPHFCDPIISTRTRIELEATPAAHISSSRAAVLAGVASVEWTSQPSKQSHRSIAPSAPSPPRRRRARCRCPPRTGHATA